MILEREIPGRMPAGTNHYPDPDIVFGSFRVLPRTDGRWIVIDERRPPGSKTVHDFKTRDGAARAAKTWHEQGHG